MIESDVVIAPSYWASALVNGDFSGLTDEEARHVRAFEKRIRPARVVSTEEGEAWFTNRYDLYHPESGCTGGEVIGYITLEDKP